jgi:hypothetical protein
MTVVFNDLDDLAADIGNLHQLLSTIAGLALDLPRSDDVSTDRVTSLSITLRGEARFHALQLSNQSAGASNDRRFGCAH